MKWSGCILGGWGCTIQGLTWISVGEAAGDLTFASNQRPDITQ